MPPQKSLSQIILHLVISACAVLVAAYVLPGVHVGGFLSALAVAVFLGIVNALIRPLIILLTLPLTVVTLGLFLLVINAFMVELVAFVVPGFQIAGFGWALLFSVVLSMVNWFLGK